MISARLYGTVFLYTVIILTFIVANKLSKQSYSSIQDSHDNSTIALLISLVYALWIGLRPGDYSYSPFGDSIYYAHTFNLMKPGSLTEHASTTDWIWDKFTFLCSQIMNVPEYFTIIALGYFGFTYYACKRLVPNHILIAILFMFGALSFYSYGTNGLRNGLACSIVFFIISLTATNNRNILKVLLLIFLAINIHKSTLLPIATLFASIYIVKSFKWAYYFWIISIFISLIVGSAITSFFAGLGFDERLSYLTTQDDKFSHTGFRWDFLIYSMMPIVLGYYVVIKRGIYNKTYLILLNTYTLSNAFWVMVIRANYSNRFAYLSWFMYPIVLAYPLLKLDIWGTQQGRYTRNIMLAHVGFTWVMQTIYW